MWLAPLFELTQFFCLEPGLADNTPVAFCRVHWEARSQSAIRSDDQGVLAGPAVPLLELAAHELLHLFQPCHGIDHLVPRPVLVNEPVDDCVDTGPVIGCDERAVPALMFELRLVKHRGLVDVVISRDTGVVCDFVSSMTS